MSKKKKAGKQSGKPPVWQNPVVVIGVVVVLLVAAYLAFGNKGGGEGTGSRLPAEVSVDEAYALYQQPDVFFVDVREQVEWDEYHAPNTTLIPLAELQGRLNEVPKDKQIVVVCRSGNRSQQGRDILLSAGYNATSMSGGLKTWYAAGYPTEGQPTQ